MRQKQAANSKLLAAQARQGEEIRKEQEKTQASEATRKQAIEGRLKTPPPSVGTTTKDTLPDPSQTNETNSKILPEAGVTKDKVTTPEGDVANA